MALSYEDVEGLEGPELEAAVIRAAYVPEGYTGDAVGQVWCSREAYVYLSAKNHTGVFEGSSIAVFRMI